MSRAPCGMRFKRSAARHYVVIGALRCARLRGQRLIGHPGLRPGISLGMFGNGKWEMGNGEWGMGAGSFLQHLSR